MYLTILKRRIKEGILHLHLPDGSTHVFGEGGLEAHWHIRREDAMRRIAANPAFELGQTYMEEAWDAGDEPDALRRLLAVLRSNFLDLDNRRWYSPLLRAWHKVDNIRRNYANISHHYDVDEFVFRRFLDREMFYSCAYFRDPGNSLEQAQRDKAEHIARKLLLRPGLQVLDIGCGWGSLAFHLAEKHDVQVTGITLSKEQWRVATEEAGRRGLAGRVRFEIADYREHDRRYDRIVSVGMLEHVGIEHYGVYFGRVRDMLKPEGVALVHSIANKGVSIENNPWIEKYIFPGGRIPSLSEVSRAVERCRLITTDVEILRLHYAYTLAQWFARFQQHREEIRAHKDESFCRMWEFYLAACESAFACANLVVNQFQLAHVHAAVPLTRDYLYTTAINAQEPPTRVEENELAT